MNTSENSEIKRLTDEDFNQISQMLNCEPAALKAVQQVEIDGRLLCPWQAHHSFRRTYLLEPAEEKGA